MKVEFFSRSLKSSSIEGYTLTDIIILRSLHPNLVLNSGYRTFFTYSNIVVSWWVTGSILPLLKVKFLGGKLVVIAGGNDCQIVRDSKSLEFIGYGTYSLLKKFVVRYVLKNADKVIIVSNYMLNRLVVMPQKLEVAYNAFNERLEKDVIVKEKVFTTIINFDENSWRIKRGYLLLEAFSRFAEYNDWKLVIIGKFDDYFKCIQSEILKLGITDSVEVYFDVPNSEVLNKLQSTGVYVQLSDVETFGMSVLEAMLSKCLIVSSFMGALPELLKGQGLYVNHNSIASIHNGLHEAADLFDKGITKHYELKDFTIEKRADIINSTLKEFS